MDGASTSAIRRFSTGHFDGMGRGMCGRLDLKTTAQRVTYL